MCSMSETSSASIASRGRLGARSRALALFLPVRTRSTSLPPWGWIMGFPPSRAEGDRGTGRPAGSVDISQSLQALLDLLFLVLAEDLGRRLRLGQALPEDLCGVARDGAVFRPLDELLDLLEERGRYRDGRELFLHAGF